MRALVTGGTGFVGANVVEALTRTGWTVRVLRRASSTMAALQGLEFETAIGDVLDPGSLEPAMAGCEAVFHVAGVVHDHWVQDTAQLYRVNVEGTRNVVAAAMATAGNRPGVQRLVYTSSQAALGLPSDATVLDESHQFNVAPGRYPYGHSKHLGEQVVQAAVRHGLDAVIVNPSVLIGPRDISLYNSQIILELSRQRIPVLPPGGINMVAVRDVGQGHLLALQNGRPGERYLLAGHNVSDMDLAQLICSLIGARSPLGTIPRPLIGPLAWALDGANTLWSRMHSDGRTPSKGRLPISGDVLRFGSRFFYADNSKAIRELGLTITPLQQTVELAVAWLREQGHLS